MLIYKETWKHVANNIYIKHAPTPKQNRLFFDAVCCKVKNIEKNSNYRRKNVDMKQSYVLSGKLLEDKDANRSQKESPSPTEQATDALPFVHLKARPNNWQRCVSYV